MFSRKIVISVSAVSFAAFLVWGAVAWACTPAAYLYPVSPSVGAAGSQVTLQGGQFGIGPVEIRWGSENGQLLAKTLGPEFTTKLTIPDKAEGVHYVVAIARDPADPSRILARRAEAFQITSNPRSQAQAQAALWDDARQTVPDEGGVPAGALAVTALGLATAGAGLVALAVVRRRKARSA